MIDLDRKQILVYATVAAAVIIIGLVSLRSSTGGSNPAPERTGSGKADREGERGFALAAGRRALVVDVSGAVVKPGVYRMPEGTRVVDAIRRAGGPSARAVTEAINRAARLTDGQQVVVPRGGGGSGMDAPGGSAAGPGSPGPVSLGTASASDLEQIDGIGPVTARKIIEFRESRGGLGSVEDLDQVSGIGPVTMESLRSALQP
ncbi:MAG: ComEA family DNA-binding protein [Solirubrobacterales bacterium]|nr:ComEA family DNA-binding protein [Solirubrobacterales bacterium]